MQNQPRHDAHSQTAAGGVACAVEVQDVSGRLHPTEVATLVRKAREACQVLAAAGFGAAIRGGSVRVRCVDDAAMSEAHQRHSGIAGPTDVLTFDLRDAASEPLDTDLIIDVEVAERQGAARGHSRESELLLYIVHGILHCLGFDDHDDDSFQAMHALEDQTLRAIGVGSVFATPELPEQGA
jgi:probable rRNA maturation factor